MSKATVTPIQSFNFGPLPTPKASGKTEYPVLPDQPIRDGNGEIIDTVCGVAKRIKMDAEEFDALEARLKADKETLKTVGLPHWFAVCAGRTEPPSSLVVQTPIGDVRVTFQDKYGMATSPQAVAAIVGAEVVASHFHSAVEIKIKGDEIADTPKKQKLFDDLYKLFSEAGALAALSFKQSVKPNKGFGQLRHKLLTVEQNIALNQVCPCQGMVATKGRGE